MQVSFMHSAALALALSASVASAQRVRPLATVTFGGVSRMDDDNEETGERQLKLEVTAVGPARMQRGGIDVIADAISFRIINDGVTSSSVTGIYFDDDSLLEFFGIFDNMLENGPGTFFAQPAEPLEFPDANLLDPVFTSDFSLGAVGKDLQSRLDNGIAPDEFVTVTLGLLNGVSPLDILDRILSGQFRVALLVQGFEDGGIETFINNPVPAPGVLAVAAAGGLLASRRRR